MKTNMTVRLRTLAALGSAALIGAALVPTAAHAADVPPLSALTDRDEEGATKYVYGKPGEVVEPVLGVANLSGAPIKGAAVQIRVIDGLNLPKTFTNCQYYVDSNLEGAWCQFDEELAVDGRYAVTDFGVAIAPDATRADSIIFRWVTPEQVTAGGGIEALAKRDSRTDESAAGTQGTLRLQPQTLPLPKTPHPIGFAGVKVIVPSATPTTSPSASATASPSPTAPSASPTASTATPTAAPTPTDGGGAGGGLPVTGSATTSVVWSGIALLVAGLATLLVARRRRPDFKA